MNNLESIAYKITAVLFTQQPLASAGFIAAVTALLPFITASFWNSKRARVS